MALTNTATHYGSVTRTFHWLTALLIITAIPLGLIANGLPFGNDEQLARKALLFSMHKTVGVTAFFVALARIVWALTQIRPQALHPDRKAETFAAATVHWMLYGSLVLVPLSGWLHHAATTGFAPIWWPFGQSLPFVPIDFRVAEFFSAWHWLFTKVLALSLILHVAGALKHAVIDRDGTMTRMISGKNDVADNGHQDSWAPLATALALWLAAIGGGSAMGLSHEDAQTDALDAPAAGQWLVEGGTLSITVRQLGADVTGSFADWVAAIDFDPDIQGDIKGSVEASIVIGSLTLGTVTAQAMGPDFFDEGNHPTALYSGLITEDPNGDGYVVLGTLSLKGVDVPIELPFSLLMDGDRASVSAQAVLDRRDFGIGVSLNDESSLGFSVGINLEMTASRL